MGDVAVQYKFFRDRREVRLPRTHGQNVPAVDYVNVDGMSAAIVSAGLASYVDLKTCIDIEEALNLWEIVQINRYNEHLAIEHSKRVAR